MHYIHFPAWVCALTHWSVHLFRELLCTLGLNARSISNWETKKKKTKKNNVDVSSRLWQTKTQDTRTEKTLSCQRHVILALFQYSAVDTSDLATWHFDMHSFSRPTVKSWWEKKETMLLSALSSLTCRGRLLFPFKLCAWPFLLLSEDTSAVFHSLSTLLLTYITVENML